MAATLIRAMFQMPIYDLVKWATCKSGFEGPEIQAGGSFMQRIGASFCAGMLQATLLYPLDTFKRCSQLNGGIGYRQAFNDSFECTQFIF